MSCKQCGNCCIDIGRTFWKNGNYKKIDSVLNDLAKNGDHEDGGKPCEMLRFQDDVAICQIHEIFGYEAKPETCKEHNGDERCSKPSPLTELIEEKINEKPARLRQTHRTGKETYNALGKRVFSQTTTRP